MRFDLNRFEISLLLNPSVILVMIFVLRYITERNETKFYLSYIDLNDLKKINDEKGHEFGDEYIRTFADTVLSQIRAGDSLFSVGGDEFILLLKDMNPQFFGEFNKRLKNNCEQRNTVMP